ncbi:MAG TPA: ferredoxin [Tenuifilaceae bacterium]|nr:ferredoxin [Tenuifilaceae bacterium]
MEDGCTSCGLCEEICPEVFKVEDEATVIEGADFNKNEDGIREAADSCPVEVIKFE